MYANGKLVSGLQERQEPDGPTLMWAAATSPSSWRPRRLERTRAVGRVIAIESSLDEDGRRTLLAMSKLANRIR